MGRTKVENYFPFQILVNSFFPLLLLRLSLDLNMVVTVACFTFDLFERARYSCSLASTCFFYF